MSRYYYRCLNLKSRKIDFSIIYNYLYYIYIYNYLISQTEETQIRKLSLFPLYFLCPGLARLDLQDVQAQIQFIFTSGRTVPFP